MSRFVKIKGVLVNTAQGSLGIAPDEIPVPFWVRPLSVVMVRPSIPDNDGDIKGCMVYVDGADDFWSPTPAHEIVEKIEAAISHLLT